MNLQTIHKALEHQLNTRAALNAFRAAAHSKPLAAFSSPAEVVRFLNLRTHCDHAQRSALTAALIAQAQRREHDLWTATLMLAFFPGLLRLRGTMKPCTTLSADELNALLIESFLETIATFPLATQSKLAVINLMLSTRKAVWKALSLEAARAQQEMLSSDELEPILVDPSPSPEQQLHSLRLNSLRMARLFQRLMRDTSADDQLLILGTHLAGKALITWVHEQNPHLDDDALLREYGRLRRRRSRLIHTLRERLKSLPD